MEEFDRIHKQGGIAAIEALSHSCYSEAINRGSFYSIDRCIALDIAAALCAPEPSVRDLRTTDYFSVLARAGRIIRAAHMLGVAEFVAVERDRDVERLTLSAMAVHLARRGGR